MTYDPISHGVVLFGGTSGDSTNPEPRSLWSWDGTRWRCLAADGPSGRDAPELSFDAARNRLVLYGGRTRGADRQFRVLSDTWEWDGIRWTMADSVGPRPRRIHQVLGFDPSRRAVLLHGGLNTDAGGRLLNDTWRWTGSAWEALPLSGAPVGGENQNSLMTTRDGLMLLMQIADSMVCRPNGRSQRAQATLFELRGSAWTRLTSDGPCVAGLPPAALTVDGMTLLSNNAPGSPWPDEAWLWHDRKWQSVESMPTRRRASRAAYDPVRRRVVSFGGDDADGMLGDTWEWDGRRWFKIALAAIVR